MEGKQDMGTEQEDAANWRKLEEYKNVERRLTQLRNEIKLMVLAPLGEIFFALRDSSPDKITEIDLSMYPEKSDVIARQRKFVDLLRKRKDLSLALNVTGMNV